MYATAHHVVSPSGAEAIHAFLYKHGEHFPWPEDPWNIPEREPGVELWKNTTLPTGNNRVRSYLDVLAPDGVTAHELDAALTALWAELAAEELGPTGPSGAGGDRLPNPVVFRHGNVVLRFGVELGLAQQRASEMSELRTAVDPATARWDAEKRSAWP